MSVITIEGRLGAGAPDLGRMVAKELGLDFVDRLMLADIAKKVGSTVTALADQESRVPSLANRFAQAIQRMLHRSAVAGMGGDPYFGPPVKIIQSFIFDLAETLIRWLLIYDPLPFSAVNISSLIGS